jgi:hypothetical protein
MSKKKGLSIEEKVVKVEEWFAENPHPYTLKEIMSLVPKAKGVIFQSIEECLELLLSEGRISSEKIGINVFYWRFVATEGQLAAAAAIKKKYCGSSSNGVASARETGLGLDGRPSAHSLSFLSNAKLAAMERTLAATLSEREAALHRCTLALGPSEDRGPLILRLSALGALITDAELKLSDIADEDPAVAECLHRQARVAIDAANRWTDNIFIMEQHVTRSGLMTQREFRMQFQVPQQFDFIEMG